MLPVSLSPHAANQFQRASIDPLITSSHPVTFEAENKKIDCKCTENLKIKRTISSGHRTFPQSED